jgi:tetratricopeptide (TPR) repeat protein
LRQAYTKGLEFSSAPAETRRTLLSNRAQCYILLGELDAALNDTTLALSNALTTLESPKCITLKLHYRQAKIYFLTGQYDKASQAFKRFEGLKRDPLTAVEKKLKRDIAGASERKS